MWLRLVVPVAFCCAVACGPRDKFRADARDGATGLAKSPATAPEPAPSAAPSAARAPNPVERRPRIVVLGDSLTAGLGLAPEQAYPALLQQRLKNDGLSYDVVNAGVSGDTSADGVSRIQWALDGDVRVLIVALGGNDGLRGVPPEELKRNLTQIIERARARDIVVMLAGMEAPPNYGPGYTSAFR